MGYFSTVKHLLIVCTYSFMFDQQLKNVFFFFLICYVHLLLDLMKDKIEINNQLQKKIIYTVNTLIAIA